ncbi:hypothetical protein CHUAL_004322 [Chamberlinius hualienensis]
MKRVKSLFAEQETVTVVVVERANGNNVVPSVGHPNDSGLASKSSMVVYIHPKSTSVNSVDFTKEIIIKPGFNYSLKFSTMIKEHLPAPYPSNCVWSTSPEQQWKNNFHDHSNEFEYTQNECQSSGNFNDTFADSFVTLPNQFQGRISMKENLEDNWTIRHQHPITDYNEIVAPYAPSWLTIGPYKVETALIAEEPLVNIETILYQLGGTMGLWITNRLYEPEELGGVLDLVSLNIQREEWIMVFHLTVTRECIVDLKMVDILKN